MGLIDYEAIPLPTRMRLLADEADEEHIRGWADDVESLRRQLAGAVEAIRTLRAYIGNIEGEGPIRYIEALELCDSFLTASGGQ
jgi:hypothetical protein